MWNFHTELVVYMVGVVCMVGIDLPVVLLYRNRVMRNLDAADSAAIEHESRPGIVRLAVNSAAVLVGFVVWFALDSAAIASGARRDAFWWVLLGASFSMWCKLWHNGPSSTMAHPLVRCEWRAYDLVESQITCRQRLVPSHLSWPRPP